MQSLRRQFTFYLVSGFVVFTFFSCGSGWPQELESQKDEVPSLVDYNFHVKPILSDRCYKCHGPDENQLKANFRLDKEEFAFKKTESNSSLHAHTIVKGTPLKSELIARLLSHDAEYEMPPAESNLKVTIKEKAIITKWIEQGATFKKHWSFIPPSKPAVPNEKNEWVNNEIDYFISKKLEGEGLKPAEKSTGENLLRRIHFDITGLPPTVNDQEYFENDSSSSRYEEKIDELLQSRHYGEHMTVRWLDLARYADTHGYQDDGLRTAWPYRDWVIKAFNENMPYDQFLTEQLAGDLLPEPTKDQLVATCFLRNHPQTQEGGIVDEEYRVEYVADRTNTFGKAMLGISTECARCHDHKYDPISQKDYFSLYAYFNNNNESGIVPYVGEASPTVILPTVEESLRLDSLKKLIAPLEAKLHSENYINEVKEWIASSPEIEVSEKGLLADFDFDDIVEVKRSALNLDGEKSPGWGGIGKEGSTPSLVNKVKNVADAAILGDKDRMPQHVKGYRGKALKFIGDCGFRFNRDLDLDRHDAISVSIWMRIEEENANGPLYNNSNGNFEGYRGWLAKLNPDHTVSVQFNHVWPDNSIDYQTVEPIPNDQWIHLAVTYDGSSKASGLNVFINGKKPELTLHTDNLRKSLLHGKDGRNWSSMPFMIGRELTQSLLGVSLDEMKVYNRELSKIEVEKLSGKGEQSISNYNENLLTNHYLNVGKDNQYNENFSALTDLRKQENELLTNMTEVMTMAEKSLPRKSHLLIRGAYDALGEEVKPRIPLELSTSNEDVAENRLELAKWLVNEKNPLTARVAVNRVWAMIFGRGIVSTVDDFGSQGSLPSHPKLLDWLAIDFMENGWDVKRLVKQVLMSSTYQQSSKNSERIESLDANNEWYSRFPKHRLVAEVIRDKALAGSGLLKEKIGGPSVYPYQPKGLWKELATRNETVYKQGEGDDLYRRSMYTIWKRSSPPPSMMNFDAPDRFICAIDRQKTSTPLQALVLMNDPQYLEAAKILAMNTLGKEKTNSKTQIIYIFKSLINRSPSKEELDILIELNEVEKKDFALTPSKVEEILSIGEMEIEDRMKSPELAALMIVASTIMNYDEFVVKT